MVARDREPRRRLKALLIVLTEDGLSQDQVAELENLLKEHPEFRRAYNDFLAVHAMLRYELGGREPGEHTSPEAATELQQIDDDDLRLNDDMGAPVPSIADLLDEDAAADIRRKGLREVEVNQAAASANARTRLRELSKQKLNRRPEPIEIPRYVAYAAAAALIAVAFVGFSHLVDQDLNQPGQQPIAETGITERNEFLARVVNSANAKLQNSTKKLLAGTIVPEGTLLLSEGILEIEFQSGSLAIIESPAEFALVSDREMKLMRGRIVGRVPSVDADLAIHTPFGTITDLGTEFGVLCDTRDHGISLHVFEGEIKIARPTESMDPPVSSLAAGQSAQVDGHGSVKLVENLNEVRFLRNMNEVNKLSFPDGPYPDRKPPVTRKLVLWLAADGIVKKDHVNRVSVWGDLVIGDNLIAENAKQRDTRKQPIWIEDSIGGRPAIRFNGESTALVTDQLTTTDNQTLFIVTQLDFDAVQPAAQSTTQFGLQLFNYHGPPQIVLECSEKKTIRGRVYRIASENGRLISDSGLKTALQSPVFDGLQTLALAYVYDRLTGNSRLYCNGKLVQSGEASHPISMSSQKHIGAHYTRDASAYFQGDIAEIAVYNAALNDSEVKSVSKYLERKYLQQLR